MTRSSLRQAAGPRIAIGLLALMLGVAAAPLTPTASADGDPASDVLLGENVFFPYSPTVSGALQRTLTAQTTALVRARSALKVALIVSPVDLGVIPDLFAKPQRYADFLDQEISLQKKQPLLVVMAAGYGAQGVSPAARIALGSVPLPHGKGSDDLARAAIVAVARMAKAEGVSIPGAAGLSGASGSGSGSGLLLGVLGVVAVLTAGVLGLITVRRNRRPAGR